MKDLKLPETFARFTLQESRNFTGSGGKLLFIEPASGARLYLEWGAPPFLDYDVEVTLQVLDVLHIHKRYPDRKPPELEEILKDFEEYCQERCAQRLRKQELVAEITRGKK